jgi:hypothetical protein
MTTAPTASSILRQLDARRAQVQIAALADMDDDAQDAVRRMLENVRPSARVDVGKLVASVRQTIEARQRAEASNMTPAERAAFQQHVAASLDRWRYECGRRGVAGAARYGLMLQMQSDAAGRGEIADRDRAPPRRRSPTRLRSKRQELEADDDAPPRRGRSRRERPEPQPEPMLLGPRAFSEHGALGPDPAFVPMRPPWLLSDGDPDDIEDEGEVEDARAAADA